MEGHRQFGWRQWAGRKTVAASIRACRGMQASSGAHTNRLPIHPPFPPARHFFCCRVGHAEETYVVVAPRHPSAAKVAVASGFGTAVDSRTMLNLPSQRREGETEDA